MRKYKLIKKLPFENSPEVGYISKPHRASIDGSHYWNHNFFHPKRYPEFWEEVVEKDYEILSFTSVGLNWEGVARKQKDGKYCIPSSGFSWTEDSMLHKGNCVDNGRVSIHSVKRLSDGEIFTVGDMVSIKPFNDGKCIINKLTIKKSNNSVYVRAETEDGMIGFGKELSNIDHSKKPLLTTEDGVDLYKGDFVTAVRVEGLLLHATIPLNTGRSTKYGRCKYFSTKEAAEEYIFKNKKSLSINNITSHFKAHPDKDTFTVSKEELTKLVKSII